MTNRTLTSVLSAGAVLASAASLSPVASAAGRQFGDRYLLYVKGHQVTTESEAEHETYTNCFHRYSGSGRASEDIAFHSAKPMRVRIATLGGMPIVQYGWSGYANPEGTPLKTSMNRTTETKHFDRPGRCGGGGPTQIDHGKDCGHRHPHWEASLFFAPGKLGFSVGEGLVAPLTEAHDAYEDCAIDAPLQQGRITPQVGAVTNVPARFLVTSLNKLEKGHALVIDATRTFSRSGAKWITKHQTVSWQVRLLKVK